MRTNLFKVKKVKDDNVVLEEEQIYNPLLLIFKKYGCLIGLIFFLVLFIIIGLVIIDFLNIGKSKDIKFQDQDLLFEYGDNNVKISSYDGNTDWIDKYANVYKKEGIIFVVKSFDVKGGTVTYYSDGSSKLVREDGSIIRISRLPNGKYGIDEKGVINSKSKRRSISIVKEVTLDSGTYIVYYSDGSAEITKGNKTILVRNSKRINNNDIDLIDVGPSGASYRLKEENVGNYKLVYYTDDTIIIYKGNDSYVIRNNEDIKIDGNIIYYPNYNEAKVIKRMSLNDGTVITYYSDGSALIEAFYGTNIMVRESKDIVLDGNNSFVEIYVNDNVNAVYTRKCPNGDEVTYYDDGSGIIRYKNGKSEYVRENSNIKFKADGNISKITEKVSLEVKVVNTPDGTKLTYFENGKCRVEKDNRDYIINKRDIVIDTDGNVIEEDKKKPEVIDDKKKDNDNPVEDDMDDGKVSGRIEDIDDNFYNFVIKNGSNNKINYRIVLEESDNYEEYGYEDRILLAKYIKYDLMFEDIYLTGVSLDSDIWDYSDKTMYVLYEGNLDKKKEVDVMLKLYFDYKDLDNSMQDHLFLGTIKLYIEEL